MEVVLQLVVDTAEDSLVFISPLVLVELSLLPKLSTLFKVPAKRLLLVAAVKTKVKLVRLQIDIIGRYYSYIDTF